ncbi:MAG: hypothetical protein QM662_06510 [Gordonia sp. (in: high G+C Gram-positive bacteria)]
MSPSTPGAEGAMDIANRAMATVPAYREFLRRQGHTGGPVSSPAEFAQLPATSKADYIRAFDLDALVWNGDICAAGMWSSTSGSTGSPTYFPRDARLVAEAADAHDRIFRVFGTRHRSTLVIVCFAMGAWIGGTLTVEVSVELRARGHRLSVTPPGLEIEDAVNALVNLAPHYQQVVLAGYPPLLTKVLDATPKSALAQDIHVLCAGQAITEQWRDHILERIGRPGCPERVALIYGTAECGVMGHETPVTTRIRRRAAADGELTERLFGEIDDQPTLVQYDPESRYTEVDPAGYLLFTTDGPLPLIRYRINDVGAVLTGVEIREIVTAAGYSDIAEQIDPAAGFLVLHGRPEVAATYCSLNIYPADLRDAFADPELTARVTGNYLIRSELDAEWDEKLSVAVELQESATATEGVDGQLARACEESLMRNNGEYRALRDRSGGHARIHIALHRYRTGPFRPGPKSA